MRRPFVYSCNKVDAALARAKEDEIAGISFNPDVHNPAGYFRMLIEKCGEL